jgi:UTP:GlnB (protein PII) uridylyltransferase
VRTADRLGLLHDIAASLTRHGFRTRSLTVLTYGGQAHDSFRVVDAGGSPIRDEMLLAAVRDDLLRVCEA